ncbi:unnamed protein product [Schistocephalus solidus]|uniref:Uncharacterized protein n=1 Tax=Schistocephalus solidus TaxID=70667 RepID=A0A183SG96_SCHSO|nr:unnamed protein product [Schistocephalus solidus]
MVQCRTKQLRRRNREVTPDANSRASGFGEEERCWFSDSIYGYIFKFDEAKLLARDDNRVSRELFELWFSGPQSINKRNEFPFPYSVLRHRLSREIGHVERTWVTDASNDSEPNCRVIITPASNMDDEITVIIDSDADGQAIVTSITTTSADRDSC